VAQKMGKMLGRCKVLQRSLSQTKGDKKLEVTLCLTFTALCVQTRTSKFFKRVAEQPF